MDVSAIGTLLLDLVHSAVILDEEERIVWYGGDILDNFKFKKGKRLTEFFPLDRGGNQSCASLSTATGRRLSFKFKPLPLGTQTFTVVLIAESTDLNSNKDARLKCLEQIMDSLDEGIVMSDYEGKVIFYNQAQEKMEGLKGKRLIGKYLWEAYDYAPEMSEHRRVFNTGSPIISQYRALTSINGVPQYITYSTYPIVVDGETVAVFSVSNNETKLKNLLHETIELKRKIVDLDQTDNNKPNNGTTFTFDNIKGSSKTINNLIKEAQSISVHNTDILIVGETGTGKELFAQSIHNHSRRAQSPFVAINCAAIPETLLESTLFGTVKGAYTGATDQVGLFEYAQDGTLFLDEINSMPLSLQSKLIRVLEERMVRRVGSNTITPVRCTVFSASNEDPLELISKNKLRSDLYYRIARTCLMIPPLRERKEDILFLIDYFINYFNQTYNKNVQGLTESLKTLFMQYQWSGNTRELKHVIENLMIRVNDNEHLLDNSHIPSYLRTTMINPTPAPIENKSKNKRVLKSAVSSVEEKFILDILEQSDWNITKAAKELGITRQSMQYHIKKLNLKK